MRLTTLLLLIPLLLAGCATPPDTTTPAATTEMSADAAPLETTTALPDAEGTFLLAINAPHPAAECPATGTTLSPMPGHSARIDHTLPEGTTRLRLELEDSAITGGISYALCIFQNGTLIDQANGPTPLDASVPATAGPITILLGPEDATAIPVNADVQIEWTLRATATLTTPTATVPT